MKFIIILSVIIASFLKTYSQNKEYFILRVTYLIKPTRIESRLEIDLGTKSHSLKNIIENTSEGTLKIKNEDGSTLIIKNEVDFFNFIQKYNFKLINSYNFTQLDKTYANFIFERNQ